MFVARPKIPGLQDTSVLKFLMLRNASATAARSILAGSNFRSALVRGIRCQVTSL